MDDLLALSRSAFEESKRYFTYRDLCRYVLLATGVASLFPPPPWPYVLALFALAAQVAATFVGRRAKSKHVVAEECSRRVKLAEAFGASSESLDVADLKEKLGPTVERRAVSEDTAGYFAESSSQTKPERLRDVLQESAFWSKQLYPKAAAKSLRAFVLPGAFVLVCLGCTIAFASTDVLLTASHLAVTFLASLWALEHFNSYLDWDFAARQAERIDQRLERSTASSLEATLAIFADYSVTIATAEPIPTSVYRENEERLNRLWKERRSP